MTTPRGGRHAAPTPHLRWALVAIVLLGLAVLGWVRLHPGGPRTAAARAGTTPTAAPSGSAASPSPSPSPTPWLPPRIRPVVRPAPHAEGRWRPAQRWPAGGSPVRVSWYLPDRANPSVRAFVAWVDTTRAHLALYPGYNNPAPSIRVPRGPTEVPPAARRRLLVTFNSGFYVNGPPGFESGLTIPAGFFVNGHLYTPMVRGMATLVAYRDGRVDIVRWQGGRRPPGDVVFARQNLPLLVAGGHVAPGVTVSEAWGNSLHGLPAVWRTAVGIDARGNLLYVAAPAQTAPSLARILVHVGAVRAMELDINPVWPIFVAYGHRGATGPRMMFPNPYQIPTRFLTPSTKDFFAVYLARTPTYRREPF